MAISKKILKVCSKGHEFYKSSSCPVCPVCEKENKPVDGFLSTLGAPARRALEREGIISLKKLSSFTEKDILKFHGMGKSSIPILKAALASAGLSFKTDPPTLKK